MNWLRIPWDRHLNQKRNKWHSSQMNWIIILNYMNPKLCKRWITLLTYQELILTFLFSFSNNYIPYRDINLKHITHNVICSIYWISYSTGQCGDLQKYHEPCKSNDEHKKYESANRSEQRSLKRFLKLYFEAIDRLYSYHVNLSMAVLMLSGIRGAKWFARPFHGDLGKSSNLLKGFSIKKLNALSIGFMLLLSESLYFLRNWHIYLVITLCNWL